MIENDFLVPDEEAILAVTANGIDGSIAVMVRPVLGIGVEVQKHVVGEVFDVKVLLNLCITGYGRWIDSHHGVPASIKAREVLIDFPILRFTSEVVGEEVICETLSEVMKTKIEAIDIQVHEVPMAGGLAHVTKAFLHPDITDVLGVVGTIAARIPGDKAPGIGKASTKNKLVEFIYR